MPQAYAVVRNLMRNGDKGLAEFWIHSSRANALNKSYLERKIISFKHVDGENPYVEAYKAALEKPLIPACGIIDIDTYITTAKGRGLAYSIGSAGIDYSYITSSGSQGNSSMGWINLTNSAGYNIQFTDTVTQI